MSGECDQCGSHSLECECQEWMNAPMGKIIEMSEKLNFRQLKKDDEKIYIITISIFQVAIKAHEHGFKKKDFLLFCEGVWDSMIMNNVDELKEILQDSMRQDLSELIKEY